ncbi:dihydrofolate reductase family protein [Janibacter sp. GXQ6167]|uniref:dihydrofolate reductase family protein n=1 Tax=Janibacter sp. GXQ6167 TaxID=3240791 RepID=UPI0035266A78
MRILLGSGVGSVLDDDALRARYAPPAGPWVRLNMVSTLDGAAAGADGLSGSINTPPDNRCYSAQRSHADAVLVGARTAQAEGYRPIGDGTALVIVSRRAMLPDGLAAEGGHVALATCAAADPGALDDARQRLGDDAVWVLGDEEVDLAAVIARCQARFGPHVLSEGGPTLAGSLLAAGLVDELALTFAPHLVGGEQPRIIAGSDLQVPLTPFLLLEEDGTLLGLWRVGTGTT